MSDNGEPAAKISKIQKQNPVLEDEMDEGQEEWLSEGVLTDDDYNPVADQSDSCTNVSQDNTMQSMNDSMESHSAYHDTGDSNARDGLEKDTEGNIEEALNNLENSQQDKEFPKELGAFLIRKSDGKVLIKNASEEKESEAEESTRQSDDDGHDTDELLRMLGEDGAKGKKNKRLMLKDLKCDKKAEQSSEDEGDDEYIFEGAKVTRLKMAKNAFIKKYPTKAVPEETSDKDETDMSSDEATTMKKMFGVSKQTGNVVSKKTTNIGGVNAVQTITKRVVSLDSKTERRQPTPQQQVVVKQIRRPETKEVKTEETAKVAQRSEEVMQEEEFLEEDFDLDEEMEPADGDRSQSQQRIMKPEQMDEEVPTDGDSQSEEDSLYDEMPSSDFEEMEDWFTLDIRTERAGDYLPLLGAKARELLISEKKRVSDRLATLRRSLTALAESGRQQSAELRAATATLAEIDASLKAT